MNHKARSFLVAVVTALLVLPVAEAVGFYSGTSSGSGAVAGAGPAAAVPNSTVSIAGYQDPGCGGCIFTQSGQQSPGGAFVFRITITCLTNCPAMVTTVSLASWSSTNAGCDMATMPGSFTMSPLTVNAAITGTSGPLGPITMTWNNLPTINQNACAGGNFTFNLQTP